MFHKKISVYIISGFLGSGKTTVLLKMIEELQKKKLKPGIILNELGDTNVESHLFKKEKVFELLNGCICCTIQDDLKETMQQFLIENEKEPVDVLLIEGTGVANPLEIKEVLLSIPFIDYFELISIITLVDASHFLDYQSIFSSSREVRKLLSEQLASANVIILNKTDLVPISQLEKIKVKLTDNVGAEKPVFLAKYGEIESEKLFEKRMQTVSINKNSLHNDNEGHHHHANIQAIKIEDLPKFHSKKLENWLKQLPKEVLRGKGVVEIEGENKLFNFQFASGKTHFTGLHSKNITKPVIILIGMNINRKQIQQSYDRYFN
ncbi:hypothetical protein DCC39_15395 [Pueribacillus theae]|uniref:GTP-binding protein n=1 Tax=Pueribacillus theae TaxID=2171751 RepID=A0A2U1JTK8_9BACI|nr:GTP-binding protein [Pueribacillus theae]PWA08168.1 hypothetical protein DCC39_15395 [Pueribacillus theae]